MTRALVSLVVVVSALATCKTNVPDHAGVATCKSDDDCTLFCESKGDCCHDPYCENAALGAEARAIEAYNGDHCTDDQKRNCPQIGARADVSYTVAARCRSGTCVAERSPRPAPPK